MRVQRLGSLAVVPLPLDQTGLINTLWWHPNRESDQGHRWLLNIMRDVAREIDDQPLAASEATLPL